MKNTYHLFHYSKKFFGKIWISAYSISSYKIINNNIFRIHKITRKLGFVKISKLFEPDYLFQKLLGIMGVKLE